MNEAVTANRIAKTVSLPSGDRLELLRGVNLEVLPGTSVAIMGRSGSGKSTLLAVLGLLTAPDSGTLTMGGVDTTRMDDRQKARLRNEYVGFVFQGYSLVPHMTAAENVELPLLQGKSFGRRERARLVTDALELACIGHRSRSTPRQLSGGEQQRAAIARALVRHPQLIIADEPTGALDTASADAVLEVLTNAAVERGAALVLATHDHQVAARTQQIWSLAQGSLVQATTRL
jgi:ABC-type lipoprotein export system ATPase subunit